MRYNTARLFMKTFILSLVFIVVPSFFCVGHVPVGHRSRDCPGLDGSMGCIINGFCIV